MKNVTVVTMCICYKFKKWHKLLALFLMLLQFNDALASDFIEVLPVTNKILVVYIKDGHIDSYGQGQSASDNVTYINATNIGNIKVLSNYQISSTDDASYSTAKSPVYVGRKSKATDYNNENYTLNNVIIPYVSGHWIYIELPTAMVQGKKYTVKLNNLVENNNTITFVYNVNKLRSPTVHVNGIGFPQAGVKYAYLSNWMGDFNTSVHAKGGLKLDDKTGAPFRLIRVSDGSTAFTGTIGKRSDKTLQENGDADYGPEFNYTHADVWECNFSSFTGVGEYVVAVDGIGCSYPFEINNDATREPFYYAMKGLFWQRQGVVKEMENGKIMPRDHHYDDIIWRWDKNWFGGENTSAFNVNSPVVKGIYGHYHDAGDWDGYTRHHNVPMQLLLLYEMAPDKFYDGEIGNRYKLKDTDPAWTDEGTNGLPDLLDEASWLIKFFKRSKDILKNNYGGTGGVPGYVGRDGLPASAPYGDGSNSFNGIPSWIDPRDWYVSAENTEQTFAYAGLAAWYASCLNKFYRLTNATGSHPDAAGWIAEATAAWNWANARTITDNDENQAKGFAAVCLFSVTNNTAYQTAFQNYYNTEPSSQNSERDGISYFDVAASIYALLPATQPGLNTTFFNQVKINCVDKANNYRLNDLNSNSFRYSAINGQQFQLGIFSTARVTLLPVAYKLTGDIKYVNGCQNAVNYVLGGNQLNMTYLSGLGEESDVWIFNPDGWTVNNPNSLVYDNEPNIGYTSYFGANRYWFNQSVYSEYVSRLSGYPKAATPGNSGIQTNDWPEAESKFYNRYSIQGAEFTIDANNTQMIFATGYVKAAANPSSAKYIPNVKPTISLNLTDNQAFPVAGTNLTATTSTDTRSVKYYYEWHYIGESTDKANNFTFFWKPTQAVGTNVLITAVGYDDKGRHTDPSNNGDKVVKIGTAGTPDTQAPAVPGALNATNIAQTSFTLNWAASTDNVGVVSYDIFKAGVLAGNSTTNSFSVAGLNATTTYAMTVKAKDAAGNISAASTPLNVTTTAVTGGGTVFNIPATIEAELAELTGGTYETASHINYTGTGFVQGYDPPGSNQTVLFRVNAASAGVYIFKLRYSNGGTSTSNLSVYVNGVKLKQTQLPQTTDWDTWATVSESITLAAGISTVAYVYTPTDYGRVNLDNAAVTASGSVTGKLEAENATLNAVTIIANGTASGGQITGNMNTTGSYLQWTNVPAGTKLDVVYNGPATTKSIYINGTKVAAINLPLAAGGTFLTASININIPANATLKIQRDATDNNWTNFDYVQISTPAVLLEAENATLNAVTIIANGGASGGQITGNMNTTGSYLQWTNVPAGTKLDVVYNGPATTKSIYINGTKVTAINLPVAAGGTFLLASINITIPANATLKIQRDATDNNWTNFDYVQISTPAAARLINNPVAVKIATVDDNTSLKLSPNPAKEVVNVEYYSSVRQLTHIRMTNQSGQMIKSLQQQSVTGKNRVSIPLNLIPGVYFISVKKGNKTDTQKLVIE
jgi:Glycosyl hydrolase family 9/Secretion system C-terminal sorting domain/Cellulase N-terminal ig-like domain/Carbohydrate binding module (family 6)